MLQGVGFTRASLPSHSLSFFPLQKVLLEGESSLSTSRTVAAIVLPSPEPVLRAGGSSLWLVRLSKEELGQLGNEMKEKG